jgi:hypothetical protein
VVNLRFSPLFSSLFFYLALKFGESAKSEEKRGKEKKREAEREGLPQ